MRGGINGGLVYFEPSEEEFNMMYEYIWSGEWEAVTDMAEQEFLSHWFGRDGRWYALPLSTTSSCITFFSVASGGRQADRRDPRSITKC